MFRVYSSFLNVGSILPARKAVNRKKIKEMAERVGFEPTVGVNLHTLSKRAP